MDARKIEMETGFIDLLIVVAENLRLLIAAPLIVGLLALGVAFALPKSYVTHAVLNLPPPLSMPVVPAAMPSPLMMAAINPTQAASAMVSPQVLDAVIAVLDLSKERAVDAAREKLAGQVKALAGKDGMVRLEVTAHSPAQAQAIANAVIDSWLKSTAPVGAERVLLEKRLAHATSALDSVARIMARLGGADALGQKKTLGIGELGASAIAVSNLQARYMDEVYAITRQLKGLSRADVLKQAPVLPVDAAGPRKGMIAVLGVLTSGFVLLVWVFGRHAWRRMAQDPIGAQKQARLRAALGIR